MALDAERAVLRVDGVVTNVGGVPADFVWGQHPAFPAEAGARIDFPAGARVRPDADRSAGVVDEAADWPLVPLADGGTVDLSQVPDEPVHRLAYLDGLEAGWAAVRQPGDGVSVAMAWDVAVHPYSWLWLMRDDPGFPFYGRGRMLAVECQTSWPYDGLTGALVRNMAHRLEPGQSLRSWYTMALFSDHGVAVTGVTRDGTLSFAEEAQSGR